MTYSPPPAPVLKTVELPQTPTPGEWIRAKQTSRDHEPSHLKHFQPDQRDSEGSYKTSRSDVVHGQPSTRDLGITPICPSSPWSVDSGIEVTPPRPTRNQKPSRATSALTDESEHGVIQSADRHVRDEAESEDEEMFSYVQPDQRTIHATFGSDPVRCDEESMPHGGSQEGFHRDEVTVDFRSQSGFAEREQRKDEEVEAEEEAWVEVKMWCPGGEGCREHHYGGFDKSSVVGLRQESMGAHESYGVRKGREEVMVSFPDVVIEPPHTGSFTTTQTRSVIPINPYHSTIHQPQQTDMELLSFSHIPWNLNTYRPLPIHPFTPILLHSPFRPPRWMTHSAFLSLHQHYSQPDPMLGRRGCWKCSLCGTGSRIPLGKEEHVGQRAVELSELGLKEGGRSYAMPVRSQAEGLGMDERGARKYSAAVDIFVRKGKSKGQQRFKGNQSTSRHSSMNAERHHHESSTSPQGHSNSPLYLRPDFESKRDRRISLQIEPYRRVRKAIVSGEDVCRHGPHKEI